MRLKRNRVVRSYFLNLLNHACNLAMNVTSLVPRLLSQSRDWHVDLAAQLVAYLYPNINSVLASGKTFEG